MYDLALVSLKDVQIQNTLNRVRQRTNSIYYVALEQIM